MKKIFLFSILSLFLFSSIVLASIPQTISIQGRLADAETNRPISNQVGLDATFEFCSSKNMGTACEASVNTKINTDSKGIFNADIGIPSNINFKQPWYIQITIDKQLFNERVPLTSVGYAFNSEDTEADRWVDETGDIMNGILDMNLNPLKGMVDIWMFGGTQDSPVHYNYIRFLNSIGNRVGGIMWNDNEAFYGDGNDFTIYSYDNRDLVLKSSTGIVKLLDDLNVNGILKEQGSRVCTPANNLCSASTDCSSCDSRFVNSNGDVIDGNLRIGKVTNEDDASGENYGNKLFFSGGDDWDTWDSDNSDPLWIARYNKDNDNTELRVNVGDYTGDAFVIGSTLASGFSPVFKVFTNGKAWLKGDLSINDILLSASGGWVSLPGSAIRSPDALGFFKSDNWDAQQIRVGSLLVSNQYSDDASKVPAKGIYSKGKIVTDNPIEALYYIFDRDGYRNIMYNWNDKFYIGMDDGTNTGNSISELIFDTYPGHDNIPNINMKTDKLSVTGNLKVDGNLKVNNNKIITQYAVGLARCKSDGTEDTGHKSGPISVSCSATSGDIQYIQAIAKCDYDTYEDGQIISGGCKCAGGYLSESGPSSFRHTFDDNPGIIKWRCICNGNDIDHVDIYVQCGKFSDQ